MVASDLCNDFQYESGVIKLVDRMACALKLLDGRKHFIVACDQKITSLKMMRSSCFNLQVLRRLQRSLNNFINSHRIITFQKAIKNPG